MNERPEPWRPAPRDGLNASRVRVRPGEPHTVLAFLQARFAHAPDWPQRLLAGQVLGERGEVLQARDGCPAGSLLWYWRQAPEEAAVHADLVVLHRCEHLLVVDKPPFLSVTPGGRHLRQTALLLLQQAFSLPALAPLHRLDRDTAGVLAFSIQPSSRPAYLALWRQRQVHKVYEAVASNSDRLTFPFTARHRLTEPEGRGFMQMQIVPGEPNAETLIECLRPLPAALALYRLTPRTGRKHQLRVQMSAVGLPIVNDRIYPVLQPLAPDDHARPLQLLARSLGFTDPLSGVEHRFESRGQLCVGGTQAEGA